MSQQPIPDLSQHPKYVPEKGRVEQRGRPKKTPPLEIDHKTRQAREKDVPKLKECWDVIKKNFRNMHGFLDAWTDNNETLYARTSFMKEGGGAAEIITKWLPLVAGFDPTSIADVIQKMCQREMNELVNRKDTPLRYAQGIRRDSALTMQERVQRNLRMTLYGSVTSNLDDMRYFIEFHAPFTWGIVKALAMPPSKRRFEQLGPPEEAEKQKNTDFSSLGAILGLLNCRNQQINSYQTIITVYLYCNGLNKSAIEVLHRLNLCASYNHLNEVLKRLATALQGQIKEDVSTTGMRVVIDNVNIFTGIRDASSIHQGRINNSTGGYITPVSALPPGMKVIPRRWLNPGARISIEPRMLRPNAHAAGFMKNWVKYYLCKLFKVHIPKLVVGEQEYKLPVVQQLEVQETIIYTTELMDIPQDSIDGNHQSIHKILTEVLGYSMQDLMEGLFLIGGDQLLADRIRSIQKLMEGDVPGEDFSYIVVLLGPLHTLMNIKKLIMRHHLGVAEVPGSLMSFNRILKRDRKIDTHAKDLWACIDLTRDSLDGVLLALAVEEGIAESSNKEEIKTWGDYRRKIEDGEINWRNVLEKVSRKLGYNYVDGMRKGDDKDRDRVLENMLLFARQELEFRAFYTSMRTGDVGAMEFILQFWTMPRWSTDPVWA